MPISISIVEDNDKLRGTLAKVIGRAEGFRFVSDYGNAEDALADLPKVKPDVVLMDINLPGMNGVECVRKLKVLLPQVHMMMLTVYEDTENIFNALAAGASGYLLKRTPTKELIDAIREMHRGGSPMTTNIARLVVQSFQKPVAAPASSGSIPAGDLAELSEREQQVLDLLAQGLIYKEIADKLNIGYETVHTYIRRIYEKLQVRTRTEAVAKFLQR
ncbi:MAG: response regulator transcription factor [Verrucomicrobiae bacterium]|nr:response regulator transcription factor [Verrucomicrobiae bacterium]